MELQTSAHATLGRAARARARLEALIGEAGLVTRPRQKTAEG